MSDLIRPQLILNRFEYSDISTIGDLILDQNLFKCNTLEDTCRRDVNKNEFLDKEEKVFGKTAIPSGTYRVILANSPRFGYCPHILNVPLFENILIHSGNSDQDTQGCILVGKYDKKIKNWIGESRNTFKSLMSFLEDMNRKEELFIEILGGLPVDRMVL